MAESKTLEELEAKRMVDDERAFNAGRRETERTVADALKAYKNRDEAVVTAPSKPAIAPTPAGTATGSTTAAKTTDTKTAAKSEGK